MAVVQPALRKRRACISHSNKPKRTVALTETIAPYLYSKQVQRQKWCGSGCLFWKSGLLAWVVEDYLCCVAVCYGAACGVLLGNRYRSEVTSPLFLWLVGVLLQSLNLKCIGEVSKYTHTRVSQAL